jgi:hypothetical protein
MTTMTTAMMAWEMIARQSAMDFQISSLMSHSVVDVDYSSLIFVEQSSMLMLLFLLCV